MSTETLSDQPTPPLSTSAELAAVRTSHLIGFKPGKSAAEIAEDEAVELPDFKLPKTLAATLELLEETRKSPVKNEREGVLRTLKVQRLALHSHTLQQVPTTKPLTSAQHTALANRQSEHADALELDSLKKASRVVKQLADKYDELVEAHKVLIAAYDARGLKIEELTPKQ